ncbi:MAG: hypothetical protein CVU41_05295 [Chloroflexi bacterium HGW-Chloroflexi-3]|nr:MAG: hypothetical protein CVU41_05295 [Chloroflexi bacterium HGW-Chloroflexi-3]
MSFFGIGPMELIFILIIMILVLGPKNMVISAQKLGITLRKIVKSPLWATVMDTSREIREIPTRLIRDAGIEEDLKNIKSTTDSLKQVSNFSVPINPVSVNLSQKDSKEKTNNILPGQPAKEQEINTVAPSSETSQEIDPVPQNSDISENLET